ncbi:hypothetical protein DVH24_021782 [Malus domestica]|uniref:Uncharacterized protein n=1 Tax=Malus domestica TaxID=3750 RepID=A0A498ITB6_MALDO|nr:hypothetical protein DVH24_021782 [Malus domestica]
MNSSSCLLRHRKGSRMRVNQRFDTHLHRPEESRGSRRKISTNKVSGRLSIVRACDWTLGDNFDIRVMRQMIGFGGCSNGLA